MMKRSVPKLNEKSFLAYVNSRSPVDKEGYLYKKGEVNRGYQKRWFILKANMLFYFDGPGEREPLGVIILEGCSVELADKGNSNSLQISFDGLNARTYVLTAEDEKSMELWIKAISSSSYDCLKLRVNELQRQLVEIEGDKLCKKAKLNNRSDGQQTNNRPASEPVTPTRSTNPLKEGSTITAVPPLPRKLKHRTPGTDVSGTSPPDGSNGPPQLPPKLGKAPREFVVEDRPPGTMRSKSSCLPRSRSACMAYPTRLKAAKLNFQQLHHFYGEQIRQKKQEWRSKKGQMDAVLVL